MKKEPLVSIIMNCYNCSRFLKESIESVYDQTYSNWEIIFWDNASIDNSAKIARSYDNKLRYFYNDVNINLGSARNLAMKEASGKYITFLDCDDIYLDFKLELQVQIMELEKYAMCYGGAIIIDENGLIKKYAKVKNSSGHIFKKLLKHYEINMQSVMIRHSILLKNDYHFNDALQYSPDYDLFMNIAFSHKVAVCNKYLVKYRVFNSSLSVQSVNIIPKENKQTLDYLYKKDCNKSKKYKKEFDWAYKKLKYYETVSNLYKGDKKKARKIIRTIIWSKYQFVFLYILLLLPINSRMILTILKRPN